MRILPTRIHGLIDFGWGVMLAASPLLLGYADDNLATAVAAVFGLGALAYSSVTDYELGLVRLVPVPAHLALDALAGGILALLPALIPVAGAAAWTFAGFGLFSLAAAFVTERRPRPARVPQPAA